MKKKIFCIVFGILAFSLGRIVNEVIGFLNNNQFANVMIAPNGDALLQYERSLLNSGCYSEFAD